MLCFDRSQHGFSKNMSCQNNLIFFFDSPWFRNVMDPMYLDFKAFRRVSHGILEKKKRCLNIGWTVLPFDGYRAGCSQCVYINGSASSWEKKLSNGIP